MLRKVIQVWDVIEKALLAYLALLLAILIFVGVFARQMEFQGFYWLEEFSRYMLILLTFLGASLATKQGEHPNMAALHSFLPARSGYMLKAIVNIACCVAAWWIDYHGWLHVLRLQKLGVKTSTLTVPIYIAYLPITVFLFLIAVRFLIAAIKELSNSMNNASVTFGGNLEKGDTTQ